MEPIRPGRNDASAGGSAQVLLDDLARARARIVGALAELSLGVALSQQVPALVELGLHLTEPGVLFVAADLAGAQPPSQLALFGDELGDVPPERLVVCHGTSLRGRACIKIRHPRGYSPADVGS